MQITVRTSTKAKSGDVVYFPVTRPMMDDEGRRLYPCPHCSGKGCNDYSCHRGYDIDLTKEWNARGRILSFHDVCTDDPRGRTAWATIEVFNEVYDYSAHNWVMTTFDRADRFLAFANDVAKLPKQIFAQT